jgi:hypothetical protein
MKPARKTALIGEGASRSEPLIVRIRSAFKYQKELNINEIIARSKVSLISEDTALRAILGDTRHFIQVSKFPCRYRRVG